MASSKAVAPLRVSAAVVAAGIGLLFGVSALVSMSSALGVFVFLMSVCGFLMAAAAAKRRHGVCFTPSSAVPRT